MKWLAAALAVVVLLLQYRIWVSDNGVRQVQRLRQAVAAQQAEDAQLTERNRQLAAEVRDLKTGMGAQRSRHDCPQRDLLPGGARPHGRAGAADAHRGPLTRSAVARGPSH
jgi:cell division protein FtsB